MSSDNFYFTRDGKVYMGFASDVIWDVEQAERKFYDDIVKHGRVYFEGTPQEASDWALQHYAEYGSYGEQ